MVSKPRGLVVDMFFGTFAIAKACLKLSQHRRFVGWEVDADFFMASTKALVEAYMG